MSSPPSEQETVIITGGTGLIGRQLSLLLKEKGYRVVWLSRKPSGPSPYETILWDPKQEIIDKASVRRADHIIHLAGENIGARRWSENRKKKIVESRIASTRLLFNALKDPPVQCRTFISLSASGYYGMVTTERIFNENDPPAPDFLGKTCEAWEQEARRVQETGIRTVILRSGVVLSEEGGILPRLRHSVRFMAGARAGKGNQYMPWIHIEDLCRLILMSIEDKKLSGTYNAAAPCHVTNRAFMAQLRSSMNKPLLIPFIPSTMLHLMFGEMAGMVLEGSRLSCRKILDTGFTFHYPDLQKAF